MTRGRWNVSQEMKQYDQGKQYDQMECFTGDETI